ncbi:MAG TPA: nucleoside-diphosphate kinase [Acidimicrobiaceae bacterium]|nr:nucleoside-diphosphate kinase [Acidimicrobiaceae bacterium]HCB36938.1 nucleoside-diphosphate kinase [Acidimicrobiaceae bacterium]
MSATLVICKPDAVERGLVGEIVGRLERKGLRITAGELRTIDRATAARHYGEHEDKPFYASLLDFVTRSPSLILTVDGPDDAGDETHSVVRTLMGATNPALAAAGTIRGDYGLSPTENLVHGSDSAESAAREIALFFDDARARAGT